MPVPLPSDGPLQSGAGGLPCYEVVGQLEVRGQRESLVDLLLVTQLPQTDRLLPQLHLPDLCTTNLGGNVFYFRSRLKTCPFRASKGFKAG